MRIPKQFVVYEVWTRSRIIEAATEEQAYKIADPYNNDALAEMSLCNWHVVEIPETVTENQ